MADRAFREYSEESKVSNLNSIDFAYCKGRKQSVQLLQGSALASNSAFTTVWLRRPFHPDCDYGEQYGKHNSSHTCVLSANAELFVAAYDA